MSKIPINIRYIAVGFISIVIGFTFMLTLRAFWDYRSVNTESSADTFAADVTAWAQLLVTNTPGPQDTPIPTRTLYPTFTPTIPHSPTVENVLDNMQDEPIIQYVIETVVVEKYIDRIITATPAPATPVPSPTINLTQEYGLIELSEAKRSNMAWWVIAVGGLLVAVLFIGAFVFAVVKAWIEAALQRPTLEETTETADDIVQRSPVEGVTIDQFNAIRWMWNYRVNGKRQYSQRDIEEEVFDNTGGVYHYKVKKVIDYLEGQTPSPPPDDYHGEGVA